MSDPTMQRIRAAIHDVPDFPKPGIVFKDITPLLGDAETFAACIAAMAKPWEAENVECVVGMESRGFIFGAALAVQLGAAFVPVRKPGKLPSACDSVAYALEYGTDCLEMHRGAVTGKRVLVVDDVIATGGTAEATAKLVQGQQGMLLGFSFLIELDFLEGRGRLGDARVDSLVHYG